MAFKIGSNTVISDGGFHQTFTANGNYVAGGLGYRNAGGQDIGELYKTITYTDQLGNCRGVLPPSNCQGQNTWTAPSGAWYNWQLSNYAGIKGKDQNPNNWQQQGNPGRNCNTQTQYWPYDQGNAYYNDVAASYVYDAYYTLYDRIKQVDFHRGYSHCNCQNYTHPTRGAVLNCLQNCNCNCNC
jgi:hypothetical protein